MSRNIVFDRELSRKTHNGVNSMLYVEKIVRERVFDSIYWKQFCFSLNEATLLDKAMELQIIGSFEISGRPFPFICLFVKMVQLAPEREIIEFYINQDRFKYLKVLGLLYARVVYKDSELIQEHLVDYRKLRIYEDGEYKLTYVDEVVDRLINEEFFIGLTLTYMAKDG
ncbi:hypothetical protein WICPIJ_001352 [Wickerhamomyces pijperi]|uniref:Pre-mRNA-splicing factor 38 n=1 Tax=Wickerhamomyces pijperi TaxID=599730 RepID=A0A9P8QBS4_WICPI|nr:hypothetical protein WICPIJ_001352 [Wickerhamomyces pijperi]